MGVWFLTSQATNTDSSPGSTTPTAWSTSGSSDLIANTTRSTPRASREDTMNIKPIHTEADYRATLREIETLMTATTGSAEGDRLDVLVRSEEHTSELQS